MKFAKVFNTFDEGIRELAKVSFSAEQALKWQSGELPTSEGDAVRDLAWNVAFDRPTRNGRDWSACDIEVTAFGVEYSTGGSLGFGWQTVLGANDTDAFEGMYVFFIEHPFGEAPEDSTLRKSAETHGWKEWSDATIDLAGATTF